MCYKKPGPRCSNHATHTLVKAKEAYDEARTQPENKEKLAAATEGYTVALEDWFTTPRGVAYLRNRAQLTGDEKFETLAVMYEDKRKESIAAYKKAVSEGEIEADDKEDDHMLGHIYEEIDDSYVLVDSSYEENDILFKEYFDVDADKIRDLEHARVVIETLKDKNDNPVYSAADRLNAEDREALIAEIEAAAAEGDLDKLQEIIDQRLSNVHFLEAIHLRNEERDAHRAAELSYRFLKDANKKQDQDEIIEWDEVQESGLTALEEYERVAFLEENLNQYKTVTARAVARAEALRELNQLDPVNTFYTDDELNQLEAVATFKSGSEEWLKSRQDGIGGSDLGKILKVDKDSTIAGQSFQEVLESKVLPISEEQIEEQAGEGFDTYSGRGNAWETAILRRFQEENPDEKVIQCKTSWQSKEWEHMRANFDGLLTNDKGEIDGILEIKTGSNKDKWGDTADGFDGLPAQYQAQTLWYARAAGVKRVKLAALIDDTEMKVYDFEITPELEEQQDFMLEKAKGFWDVVEYSRENGIPDKEARRVGVPRAAISAASWNGEARRTLLSNLVGFRDQTKEEIEEVYYKKLGARSEKDVSLEVREAALKSLYTEFDVTSRKRPFVGLDLEVSGFAPTRGRILELGMTVMDRDPMTNEYVETEGMDRLYGLKRKAREGKGTGAEHIHHIGLDMVKDKATFENPQNQKEILEKMKKGPLVAHNAIFEDAWLKMHLPGYAKAREKGEITILDTMMVSRHVLGDDHGMPNHKLQSFVERYGEAYANAHRAKDDTDMMMSALSNFEKEMPTL